MEIRLPEDKDLPRPGFYYHKKHDPAKGITDYAYEVAAVNVHTETLEVTISYRPLYEHAEIRKMVLPFQWNRPDEMWKPQEERFSRVENLDVVSQLLEIRNRMYPDPIEEAYPDLFAHEAQKFLHP